VVCVGGGVAPPPPGWGAMTRAPTAMSDALWLNSLWAVVTNGGHFINRLARTAKAVVTVRAWMTSARMESITAPRRRRTASNRDGLLDTPNETCST